MTKATWKIHLISYDKGRQKEVPESGFQLLRSQKGERSDGNGEEHGQSPNPGLSIDSLEKNRRLEKFGEKVQEVGEIGRNLVLVLGML